MGGLDRYYRILGLEPGASEEEVKEAYRDLAKVWHPDRFSDKDSRLKEKAEAKTKELNEAHRKISQKSEGRAKSREGAGPGGFEEREPPPFDPEASPSPAYQPSLFNWFIKALVVFSLLMVAVVIGAGIVGKKMNMFLGGGEPGEEARSSVDDIYKAFKTLKTELKSLDEGSGLKAEKGTEAPLVAIGVTREEVVRILGAPDKIERSSFGELWWYNKSSIQFMGETVMAYSDRGDLNPAPVHAPKTRTAPRAAARAKKLYQYKDKKGSIYITDKARPR